MPLMVTNDHVTGISFKTSTVLTLKALQLPQIGTNLQNSTWVMGNSFWGVYDLNKFLDVNYFHMHQHSIKINGKHVKMFSIYIKYHHINVTVTESKHNTFPKF